MKKLVAVCLGAILAVSVTGCGDNVKLSNEQNDMIAEYVAGVMLKYSYDNEWDYQKLKIAQNTYNSKGSVSGTTTGDSVSISHAGTAGNTTSSVSKNTGTGTSSNTLVNGSAKAVSTGDVIKDMKSVMNLNNADISCTSFTVGERYPTEEFAICVPASEGCKVIAVEFEIKNNTSENIVANTGASGINCRLLVNGTTIKQMTSMLKNDISALSNVSIPSGAGYTAVAVFQVADSIAENITSSTLEVYENTVSLGNIPVSAH